MLNLYPRLATSGAATADEDEPHICYGIMVAFVSLLLFCVLLAVVSVARACAITGLIVLLFGLLGWFAPTAGVAAHRNGGGVAMQQPAAAAVPALRLVRRCTCGLTDAAINALPTFAYECPVANKGGGDDGGDKPRGSCVLCAVCLEDLQGGEMVRQLPPCRHLFHVDCIDMWLHTHRTCPLCRCELPPRKATAKALAAAAAATESSTHALPPV